MSEDMLFSVVSVLPLIAGIMVGRRSGWKIGLVVGIAAFVLLVLVLVALGFGY